MSRSRTVFGKSITRRDGPFSDYSQGRPEVAAEQSEASWGSSAMEKTEFTASRAIDTVFAASPD